MSTNKSIIEAKGLALAQKCAESVNLKIIDVEYVFENGINILRVIADGDNGLSLDDATKLNEIISDRLDVEDFIDEQYYLEVCSEGIEKELRNDEDISNAVGEYIYAEFKEKVNNLMDVYGDLLSYNDGVLEIKCNFKGRIKTITINKDVIKMIRLAIKF